MVDGKPSSLINMVSGVPHGTVLGHLLFLLHINDLLSMVSSKVIIFDDNCLIYRNIKNKQDQNNFIHYHYCLLWKRYSEIGIQLCVVLIVSTIIFI